MNEVDEILLQQLHEARKRKVRVRRFRKRFPNEPLLDEADQLIDGKIAFFESMISDKSLLHKKHKHKKQKQPDILCRNPILDWYKFAFMATNLGYKMLMDSAVNYMSYFKKGKE